jgi:hypothetical protein
MQININLKKYVLVFIIFFIPIIFYWETLPNWWTGDDTILLVESLKKPLFDFFYKPGIWHNNLTPILILKYKVCYIFFGFQAKYFYIIHLLSTSILLVAIFLFLRIYLSGIISLFVCVLFTLTPAFANNINYFMTTHYIDGLTFSFISLLLFHYSLNKNKVELSVIGALFYFLATLSKEVYVPLLFVLPLFWIKKEFEYKQIKYLIPYIIIAIIYPFYRKWMLGVWLGGYGDLHKISSLKPYLIYSVNLITNNHTFILIVILLFCFINLINRNILRSCLLISLVIFATLYPVYHVLGVLGLRHMYLPTCLIVVCLGFSFDILFRKNKIFIIIPVLFIILFGLNNIDIENHMRAIQNVYEKEGKFYWNSKKNMVIIQPSLPMWYYSGLREIKNISLKSDDIACVIYDLCIKKCLDYKFFKNNSLEYYSFDSKIKKMKKLSHEEIFNILNKCKCKKGKLFAKIWQDGYYIKWIFKPYKQGQFYFVTVSDKFLSAIKMPKEGSITENLKKIAKDHKLYACHKKNQYLVECINIDK